MTVPSFTTPLPQITHFRLCYIFFIIWIWSYRDLTHFGWHRITDERVIQVHRNLMRAVRLLMTFTSASYKLWLFFRRVFSSFSFRFHWHRSIEGAVKSRQRREESTTLIMKKYSLIYFILIVSASVSVLSIASEWCGQIRWFAAKDIRKMVWEGGTNGKKQQPLIISHSNIYKINVLCVNASLFLFFSLIFGEWFTASSLGRCLLSMRYGSSLSFFLPFSSPECMIPDLQRRS